MLDKKPRRKGFYIPSTEQIMEKEIAPIVEVERITSPVSKVEDTPKPKLSPHANIRKRISFTTKTSQDDGGEEVETAVSPLELRTFKANEDDVILWINEFRLVRDANMWNEEYALLQLMHKLNPAARYWLDGLREYYDKLTVGKILDKMALFYNKSYCQFNSESVMEYHARFMKLVYKVNLPKDQRSYWFRRGLVSSLKSKISLSTFNDDLYGMLLKAKELEQLNMEHDVPSYKIKSKIKIKPEKIQRPYIICNYCKKAWS